MLDFSLGSARSSKVSIHRGYKNKQWYYVSSLHLLAILVLNLLQLLSTNLAQLQVSEHTLIAQQNPSPQYHPPTPLTIMAVQSLHQWA
jgi:hypothetical protein